MISLKHLERSKFDHYYIILDNHTFHIMEIFQGKFNTECYNKEITSQEYYALRNILLDDFVYYEKKCGWVVV